MLRKVCEATLIGLARELEFVTTCECLEAVLALHASFLCAAIPIALLLCLSNLCRSASTQAKSLQRIQIMKKKDNSNKNWLEHV